MTRVTYARARRKLADLLTSSLQNCDGTWPEVRSPVPDQTGLREDYFHSGAKNIYVEVHSNAVAGAIALRLHPFKVKEHMIPDRPKERQVRNASIDQAQQAEHSRISTEDRFQIQRWNRYTDSRAGAHEKRR